MTENKIKVLVVDDNPTFADLIKEAFEGEFEITAYQDGARGIAWAKTGAPDIILLDVNMPGMSGIEVVKKLLDCPETRRIPVLVLSATDYNTGTESLFRKEKNVKGFMTKLAPIDAIKESLLRNLRRKE